MTVRYRTASVSVRSLHAGFRKYYGVPPMTYLRNERLDQARLRLKRQNSGEITVTDIALAGERAKPDNSCHRQYERLK